MKLVKSPLRILTVAALGVALTLPMMSDAFADSRGRYRHGGHHRHGGYNGAYIGLGLGALALGGALAYAATQPRYYEPPPVYYAPPPAPGYYVQPAPTYYYAPPTYTYSDAPYEQPRHWGN